MPWPWQVRQARRATATRLGLTGLLPVRPPVGPAFGAIVGQRGDLTALLTLEGRRLWLEEPTTVEAALTDLTACLAGPPVQLLLRRRRLDPMPARTGWRALARANLAEPAQVDAATRDYWVPDPTLATDPATDNGLARDDRAGAGLARVTAALAIAASNPAQLWRRVGPLLRRAPGGARALDMPELADWVRDWSGAHDLPPLVSQDRPTSAALLAPERLRAGRDRLLLGDDRPFWVWQVTGLPPLVELGWVRHVLAEPALMDLEWDLSLHCLPPADVAAERRATERSLQATDRDLARAALSQPATRAQLRALRQTHTELTERLTALEGSGQHLRRVGLWMAARGDAEAAAALAATCQRLGFRLTPVRGRLAVEHAWRAIGPLTQPPPDHDLPLVLTAAETAPLAWWAVTPGQPVGAWPATLVSPERTPLLTPALLADDDHLLVTGNADDARAALQSWALEAAWRGWPVLALQPGDAWTALARAIGGPALWLGPDGDHGLDPIADGGARLATRAGWLTWLEESVLAVSGLLPMAEVGLHDDLRAGLIELGQAWLEHGQPASLPALLTHLENSGYERAAAALRPLLVGRWRWLEGPSPDLTTVDTLTAVGWAGGDVESFPAVLAWLLRRIRRECAASASAYRRPLTVIVDGGDVLLDDPRAAAALADLARNGRAEGIRLWLAAGASAGLTRTVEGRALLANAEARAAFAEPAARPHELVEVLGWTMPVARLVPMLPAGVAVLRWKADVMVGRLMSGALVEAAVARGRAHSRLTAQPSPIGAPG